MFCAYCNYRLQVGWKFCPKCSKAIDKNVSKALENESKDKLWVKLQSINRSFGRMYGETVMEYGLMGAKFVQTRKEHSCKECGVKIKTGDFALTSSMCEVISSEIVEDMWNGVQFNVKRDRPTRIYRCLKCAHNTLKKAKQLDGEVAESHLFSDIDYAD